MPTASGSAAASSVQRRLPVSRRTVRSVVAQGMWKRNRQRNSMQFRISHPAADRVTPMAPAPGASVKLPPLCRIRKQYRNGQLICRQGERQCQQNRTVDAEPCADRIQRRRERQEQVPVRRTDMAYQP